MSEQKADPPPPAKKAKGSSTPSSSSSPSRRAQLPSLLAELNGGKAVDLTVLAAIEAASAVGSSSAKSSSNNPHDETLQSTLNELFTKHVGTSPQIVVGNAMRWARMEVNVEGDIFNKKQTGSYFGDEHDKWLNHPTNTFMHGPRPSGRVWLEMFLGEERAGELLEGTVLINDDPGSIEVEVAEVVISRFFKREAMQLRTVDLLANILSYVRERANKMKMAGSEEGKKKGGLLGKLTKRKTDKPPLDVCYDSLCCMGLTV